MKFAFWIASGVLLASAALADVPVASIIGLFKDSSGNPVTSLQVVFEDQAHFGTGQGSGGVTDAHGNVTLYRLKAGQYQMFIPSTGQTRMVTVSSSGTVTLAPFVVEHVTGNALGGIIEHSDAIGR